MSYTKAEQFQLHIDGCAVCSGPDDGCDEGAGLEEQMLNNVKEYRAASVLNRTEVKRRLLLFAKDTRAHKFTRVSKDTLDTLESRVENMIRQHVTAAPSRGVTL